MSNNRREFLKLSGLGAAGVVGAGLASWVSPHDPDSPDHPNGKERKQLFNMCGYAAPKLNTVRIGVIGLGNRGSEAVPRLSFIEGVAINGLCDLKSELTQKAKQNIKARKHDPVLYSGGDEEWMKLCERDDIDLIYICTPWKWHTPMAVYAMKQGKHVAVEVPAAQTLDQCWQLVETSEKTKRHCVMLENVCFDFFELLTMNMARQGFFGEVIHGEGAYIHNISKSLFDPVRRPGLWRLGENSHRNGNLYPTHGIGPVCQVMNVNRGDRFDFMVSVSTGDFTLNDIAKEMAAKDPTYQKYVGSPFRGNMNTTTIRTVNGKTIVLQHDISSVRPKSFRYLISGTNGIAQYDTEPPKLSQDNEAWFTEDQYKKAEEKYTLPFVTKVGALAKEVGGHGGMDFLMDWRLIDCLRHGLPVDFDVYDAALWSSIVPLSEWEVAHQSKVIKAPDFTCGSWKTNKPVNISIDHLT